MDDALLFSEDKFKASDLIKRIEIISMNYGLGLNKKM